MNDSVPLSASSPSASDGVEFVMWPPRVGARIHCNFGNAMCSWTAEVRAVVDDEVAVLWKTHPAHGRSHYDLLDRLTVRVWNGKGESKPLRYGPLPKSLCRLEDR